MNVKRTAPLVGAVFICSTNWNLLKLNQFIALIFERTFLVNAVAVIRELGNIKGFFLSICGENDNILLGFAITRILRESFYFIFIDNYGLDGLYGCIAVFDCSYKEANHRQCTNAYKK